MTEQIWLDVPYDDKDAAKAAGARWDRTARSWYAGPRANLAALARWAPLPDRLPGEDRNFGAGLFVDLVPSSCWFTNVRTCIAPGDWDRVRRMVYGRAAHRCEACGREPDPAAGLRLEAHERWDYDTAAGVQRLARLICLCSDCHAVTHFGRTALVQGRQEWAMTHLQTVTGLSPGRAVTHVDAAFAIWKWRSTRVWSLDLSILIAAGITLAVPPDAAERPAHAAAGYRDATGHPAEAPVPGGNPPGREHAECGCSDPYGNGACDGPRVTVTEYDGLPPWMLTAPIDQITFSGPNPDQQRAALLEIRAEAARTQPAPAPQAPAAPAEPHPIVQPVVPPPVGRAPSRAKRWPRRRP